MAGQHIFLNLLVLFVTLVVTVESANILGVFTSNSPSHQIIHMSYVRALAERGHNVTVVSTLPLKYKNPNFHHILIPESPARTKKIKENMALLSGGPPKGAWGFMQSALGSLLIFGPIQYDAIKHQRFQDIMHNPDNKFDLIILGYFFSDYQLGLGEHFKCPMVISLTAGSNSFVDRYVGNPQEISYLPSILYTEKADSQSFFGRLKLFYANILSRIFMYRLEVQLLEFYNDLFPAPKYPPIQVAAQRVSLILTNSHMSEGIIRPNVPAVVDVGGIQIKEKADPLPKKLQDIIDSSSEHGVIYLSFGSNLGSKDFKPEIIEGMYKALASLKQTVLWKWSDTEKPGNASNIHFESWLPQDDLLAQPNVKLFITHAGKGSVAESQYHGVPMVAIPMFADQPGNARKLREEGFGLQLDIKAITEENMKATVMEVLENPKYTQNVQRFSKMYRDRPMSAKATAIYWIEYVLRHKGAYHMQSPAVHLNAFQYLSLDVIGFLLLVVYLAFKLVTLSVKFVFRKIFSRASSKKQKVN